MAATTVKFEYSPAESMADSFASSPDAQYPSLFPTAMTPPFDDDSMFDESMSGSVAGTPAPEKKQVKKRKSWGQQLPEPKTNLPPRKRAKTEDEKEQRRVERVLRNRRAAQSSRERKRQEVEALESQKESIERRNRDLEMRLADAEAKNLLLQQQIAKMTGSMTVFNQTSPVSDVESLRQATPLTFSQELFSSHDASPPRCISQTEDPVNLLASTTRTVNPASLSPEIKPVEGSSNAMSVERTTALDDFDDDGLFDLSAPLDHPDFSHYLGYPDTTLDDPAFLENGILPVADSFNLEYAHMAGDDAGLLDTHHAHHNHGNLGEHFDINDFLHSTTEPGSNQHENQSESSAAEKTASLQPLFGASFDGCDDGRNAVSV